MYKSLDEVLRVLETEGIARVAQRMYPVANIKGMDRGPHGATIAPEASTS